MLIVDVCIFTCVPAVLRRIGRVGPLQSTLSPGADDARLSHTTQADMQLDLGWQQQQQGAVLSHTAFALWKCTCAVRAVHALCTDTVRVLVAGTGAFPSANMLDR
jgi:hypothetical protein